MYLGTRRRKVATVLSKVLRVAETGYLQGKRSRDEILGPANEIAKLLFIDQYQLDPSERASFEIDSGRNSEWCSQDATY
jgi:pantoate--beta-alanine ligase